jgi:hypothetical protein
MSRAVKKKAAREASASESFEHWFDRELAEINAGLSRLEASLPLPAAAKPPTESHGRVKRRTTSGAALTHPPAPPPPALTTATSAAAPAATVSPSATVSSPASTQPSAEPAAILNAPPPAAPSAPPLPTGTDLADPKNFGLMPATADLERGTATADEYRQRLARHIAFANKVLHTSRVPAAVWREWRAFEKAAQERLRELTSRPVEAVEQY